jgi:hypothetical protein
MAHVPNRFADWGKGTSPVEAVPPARVAPHPSRVRRFAPALVAVAAGAAAVGAVLALTLGGSGGAAAGVTALAGGWFKTAYPAGFLLSVSHPVAGATVYQLTSPSTTAVAPFIQGPPPAGVVAVDITDVSVALVESLDHDPAAGTQKPIQILPSTVDEPSGAAGVVNSVPVYSTTLDGLPAAAAGYYYTYQGVGNVQLDELARDGAQLEGIEMDTEPSLTAQGRAALSTIIAHWSWSVGGSSPHSGGAVTS